MVGPILAAILPGIAGRVMEIANTVVDRVVVDKNLAERAKAEIAAEFAKADIQGALAQIELNKIEAGTGKFWNGGWRPGVGWVCVLGLFLQFIFFPLFYWIIALIEYYRCIEMCVLPPTPKLDEMLWQLVLGMLGMGAMRSYEKHKGVASK